ATGETKRSYLAAALPSLPPKFLPLFHLFVPSIPSSLPHQHPCLYKTLFQPLFLLYLPTVIPKVASIVGQAFSGIPGRKPKKPDHYFDQPFLSIHRKKV